jgi:hypothetical protein
MPYNVRSCFPAREGSGAATCPAVLDPVSLLRRASTLSCVSRLRILPPCLGGLWCYHMSCGFESCLPTQEGSGAATRPAALDPASLLGRAPTLPRVPQLWILPPYSGGIWCCHTSRGSGSCLSTQEGSGATTHPVAPNPASLLERAPVLSHVPRL